MGHWPYAWFIDSRKRKQIKLLLSELLELDVPENREYYNLVTRKAIDKGIVGGAAIDCDPEKFGDTTNDFYKKALSNSKVLVTPHIAFSTKQAIANGAEIAVQNIEAYIGKKPQNILTKV